MIRLCIPGILMIMVIVTSSGAWAQGNFPAPPPAPQLLPAPNPQPPMPDNPIRVLSHYFQFTPEQVESIERLLEIRNVAVEPLLREIAAAEKGLRDLIAAGAGPLEIGDAVIAIESLRKRVQEAHRQFMAEFRQLLTSDQKSRLQQLERAMRLQPVVNAARALGVL